MFYEGLPFVFIRIDMSLCNMFIPSGPQPELVPVAVSAQNFDVGKFSDVVFPW